MNPSGQRTNLFRVAASLALGAVLAAHSASASPIVATYDQPALDRWMEPFNSSPGYRTTGSSFGSIGVNIPGFNFDDRFAQILIGFDTNDQVPPGRGLCGYRVLGASVVMTVANDLVFPYDATYDAWTTYTTAGDGDGRPVELYGAAFRNGWTACDTPATFPCFFEGTASNPGPPFSPGGSPNENIRNAFATDFKNGVERDVSNNIRDGFDPTPFAIGRNPALTAGQYVPVDTELTFVLDVANPDIQLFLRRAMDTGLLRLMVATLQQASSGGGPGSGEYASFYMKEIGFPGLAARLSLSVQLSPTGDANGDGVVSFADVTAVLANFGVSGHPGVAGDADCSGTVNFADVTSVLANFGASAP
jgi:hypothetical protein